jgi:hypothetical protein
MRSLTRLKPTGIANVRAPELYPSSAILDLATRRGGRIGLSVGSRLGQRFVGSAGTA